MLPVDDLLGDQGQHMWKHLQFLITGGERLIGLLKDLPRERISVIAANKLERVEAQELQLPEALLIADLLFHYCQFPHFFFKISVSRATELVPDCLQKGLQKLNRQRILLFRFADK